MDPKDRVVDMQVLRATLHYLAEPRAPEHSDEDMHPTDLDREERELELSLELLDEFKRRRGRP